MLRRLPSGIAFGGDSPSNPSMTIRALGTAGFEIVAGGRTVVVDPFISRPSLWQTALFPLVPNADKIIQYIPHADEVLIGHAHHDHVLDAPALCAHTGARFIGSHDACNVARAAGLPEAQIVETEGREDIGCGDGRVRGYPSIHGKVYLGRVSLSGDIPSPPPWPPRFFHLKHGQVLNWLIELGGVRVVHIDSADFIPSEIADLRADVLCLCAIGRKHRPDYTREAISIIQPKWVIPCHWDWFFDPIEDGDRMLPFVDLPGFIREIAECGATPVVLPTGGTFVVASP